MSVYTYQEASEHFVKLLEEAKNKTVIITDQNGKMFSLQLVNEMLPVTKPNLTRTEIISYIREIRERFS